MSAIMASRSSTLKGLVRSVLQSAPRYSSSCRSCVGSPGAWRKFSVYAPSQQVRNFASNPNPVRKVKRSDILTGDVLRDVEVEANEKVQQKKQLFVAQNVAPIEEVIDSDPAFQSPDFFQVHNLFTVRELFDARVHLGHKVGSLHPNMMDFVFGSRFDSVIFDLDKTAFHLRQALNFTAHIAYRKGIIMFVTRSPHAINLVEQTAIECGEYAHCREWHTHIMTNSENKFGGITRLPDLVIFLSTLDSVLAVHRAVHDANKMLIPTVAIVDSNSDPNLITYPVPGNDDTLCAVQFYCKMFKEAILRGKQKRRNMEDQLQNKQQIENSES
ncbi:28S ribosomal protein S2, mitochondrial [Orchesella cincta]|uniref:Small ribosomal subunit protein uS2m n=1 Tax=Orchesella cincta TaxID=48709 RepID=A0A1D2MX45_ORCCI|nr:28S ribosomal protein S2, mitochondrial [Orchesella cincta]